MTREELIEALEKADGPSTKLDEAIHRCLKIPLNKYAVPDGYEDYGPSGDIRYAPNEYTSSIDAALTLVPDRMCWSVERRDNYACAKVFRYDWRLSGGPRDISYSEEAGHFREPSPAIALCIAALKARGDMEKPE